MAAVAAILSPDLELLLIRRAPHPSDPWSGHVAFPGGRVEPKDPDPLAASMRETLEEVGLELDPSELVGPLDDLAARGGRPGLVVRPFVFAIDRRPELRPNYEVASTHWLSLQALLEGHGRGSFPYDHQGQRYELPRVDFEGHRLWGMTLHMVDDLLHRLDGQGTGLRRPIR